MKIRAQSQLEPRGKTKGFNTKGYFYMVEPYCQQYLKVKHASYQKTRRLRESKKQGKQNTPIMFDFNQPKSGFYQLKGCNLQKVEQARGTTQHLQAKNAKPEYLSFFLKKYRQRKQRKQQQDKNVLPLLALTKTPHSISVYNPHCQSTGLAGCQKTQDLRVNMRKLRTEPLHEYVNNKSCQNLGWEGKVKR